jgi:hypothetical protein
MVIWCSHSVFLLPVAQRPGHSWRRGLGGGASYGCFKQRYGRRQDIIDYPVSRSSPRAVGHQADPHDASEHQDVAKSWPAKLGRG